MPGRAALAPAPDARPWWHVSAPAIARHDGRPLPTEADVVVIGGGYTGLVSALRLARGGARVTLMEAEGIGFGASSRNGGLLHPGLQWGRAALVERYGAELGATLYRAGLDAAPRTADFITAEGFGADLRQSGLAVVAWSPAHLRSMEADLAEMLDEGRTGRFLPDAAAVRAELGSDQYHGGWVIEESWMLHPGRYVAALAEAVAAAGVDLHTGTRAQAIERDGSARVVVTDRGRVRAGKVVLATNGYTDGVDPWMRARILPIGSYIIATEPMSEELAASISPHGRTFWDSKWFLYYWHVNAERRLIFGGRASFRRTSVPDTAAILAQALAAVHPQAAHLRIEHAWGGKVAFTFDRLPHIGERDGVIHALGYCGSGIALATVFGMTVAERILAGPGTARTPSPFEQVALRGAPVLPAAYHGNPWFLPIAGEWFRFLDRRDRRARPSRSPERP